MKTFGEIFRGIPCGRCFVVMLPTTAAAFGAFLFCERVLHLENLFFSLCIQGTAAGTTLIASNQVYVHSKKSSIKDVTAATIAMILDNYGGESVNPSIVIDPKRYLEMKEYLLTQVDSKLVEALDDCVSADGHVVWRQIAKRVDQLQIVRSKLAS